MKTNEHGRRMASASANGMEAPPSRVLVVHNAYQRHGGEDSAVADELALLRTRGHAVESYTRSNDDIAGLSGISLAQQTLWSRRTVKELNAVMTAFRPDVLHVHNTFPLISPSLYWAAEKAGVPLVQTLHNFRLMCLNAIYLRDGKICEDCSGRLPWRGVAKKCYHASTPQSAVLAGMLTLHRAMGTYNGKVTRYIALNEFCRGKFIAGGLPPANIVVKPNFVDMPLGAEQPRQGGLFVGRLSPEKGINVLSQAMGLLPHCRLNVIGSGPEEAAIWPRANIRRLGFLPRDQIVRHMQTAAYLLMPSIWYENFPITLVEAFACGLPVIASRLGAMAELVEHGRTGLLFEPHSAGDLAQKIAWAEANPGAMREMGRSARNEYEAKYTPERNYQQLSAIYAEAISAHRSEAAER